MLKQVTGKEVAETPTGKVPHPSQHPPVPYSIQGPPFWSDRWKSSSQKEPIHRHQPPEGLHSASCR